MPQTDHVEFDLQSAVVESLDEAGDGILRSRKTYAFRLVNYDAQYAAVRSALTRTPSEESRGSSTGAGGESGKGLEGQVGVERNEGKMDGVISGMDDSRRVRQIWLLAANSFKVRIGCWYLPRGFVELQAGISRALGRVDSCPSPEGSRRSLVRGDEDAVGLE